MIKILKAILLFLFIISGAPILNAQTLTLLGEAPVSGRVYDIWGYFDSNTNKEYALIGSTQGLFIFDVTNPATPVQVDHLSNVPGFDIKVWQNYAYCVTGGYSIDGGMIVDLSDPTNAVVAGTFDSHHNIFIDSFGYLYMEAPGLKILSLSNPINPVLVFETLDNEGHDAVRIGNRLFDFHGFDGTNIYDVTNPASPQLLASIMSPNIVYNHSGWTTEDGNYLYICDELASGSQADITIWDIRDYENIVQVAHYTEPTASIHNLYIKGNYAFVSHYEKGFRVFKISNPLHPQLIAEYDPLPGSMTGFNGTFGVYIFAPSGNLYVSDDDRGLLIFDFDSTNTSVGTGNGIPRQFVLNQNYPNPFNPLTKISFTITSTVGNQNLELKVYNSKGQEITTLANGVFSSGLHEFEWDATGQSSGIYFYKLSSGDSKETKKMVLMK